MSTLQAKIAAAPGVPSTLWAQLEAAFAKYPILESVLVSLEGAVGAVNINWATLLTIIVTAVSGGGGIGSLIAAILMNLGTILSNPAAHAATASAAVAKHLI